jgi:hypothetical protein
VIDGRAGKGAKTANQTWAAVKKLLSYAGKIRHLGYNYGLGQQGLRRAMKQFFRLIKGILLWSYSRKTWQYDVLCALILAFIFLTPKGWFETSELRNAQAHQSRFNSILLADPELISAQTDRVEIERRVRRLTGHPETEVLDVHPKLDAAGKIVAYEVDIR